MFQTVPSSSEAVAPEENDTSEASGEAGGSGTEDEPADTADAQVSRRSEIPNEKEGAMETKNYSLRRFWSLGGSFNIKKPTHNTEQEQQKNKVTSGNLLETEYSLIRVQQDINHRRVELITRGWKQTFYAQSTGTEIYFWFVWNLKIYWSELIEAKLVTQFPQTKGGNFR